MGHLLLQLGGCEQEAAGHACGIDFSEVRNTVWFLCGHAGSVAHLAGVAFFAPVLCVWLGGLVGMCRELVVLHLAHLILGALDIASQAEMG